MLLQFFTFEESVVSLMDSKSNDLLNMLILGMSFHDKINTTDHGMEIIEAFE